MLLLGQGAYDCGPRLPSALLLGPPLHSTESCLLRIPTEKLVLLVKAVNAGSRNDGGGDGAVVGLLVRFPGI